MRLRYQFELIRSIRKFFEILDFLETPTPPMVENPGMETHIHPFEVIQAKDKKSTNLFLHTSPEFHLKGLLSDYREEELSKIYSLGYCFRNEPTSEIHRQQFLMLEWYRVNSHYEKVMEDTEQLIEYCYRELQGVGAPVKKDLARKDLERVKVQEIMREYCDLDILNFLDSEALLEKITKDFPDVPMPQEKEKMLWEDYFFLLFLNKVEPKLKDHPKLLLYEFPAPLAALSTLKPEDPRVCERFEVYIDGIELCNCFNELTDLEEQKKRFQKQAHDKEMLYSYNLPEPHEFYASLEKGLPQSCGNALGVERLLSSLTTIENPFF